MKPRPTSGFTSLRRAFWLACCLIVVAHGGRAADDPAGTEFFESKIRPILVDDCYGCHSAQSKKLKGGLRLDSREGLRAGGDTGPAVTAGEPEKSLLIKAVRYQDADLQMPPKGKKLSAEKIAALEAWVKMGAPDPRVTTVAAQPESIREKARVHWAFQPIKEPAVPEVKNKRIVQTPVDNFVLARLEAKGLRPSPQADKRTLIRRATFDLTGLPPAPEQVAAFLADRSPDAFDRVVDRLLDSPQYGERWGRYWLDVARYADTKGYVFEEDRHYPYSYTYRDYVIRAFNEDLPYDQFIKEQLAADMMTNNPDKRALAALGYLTLGRRFINNINDIIDDRIDVVCRGTMGLTVNCARCHDHKFDPIPTRDYYSLYGVFSSSTEPENEPLLGIDPPAKERDEYLAEHKKREDALTQYHESHRDETAAKLREKIGDYLLGTHDARQLEDKSKIEGLAAKRKLEPEIVRHWIKKLDGWEKGTNAIFEPWFAFAAIPEKEFAAKAAEVAAKLPKDSINPLVFAEFAGKPPTNIDEVAGRYGKVFSETDTRWHDLLKSTNAPAPTALPEAPAEAVRQILYGADMPANPPRDELDRYFDVPTGQKVRELRRHVAELDASHPGAPPRATALADSPNIHNVQVFTRGNSDNRSGPEIPRHFLELITGPNPKPFKYGSGRLELAEDIVSKDNPLTARVFVNRVWLHHFGTALVSTPSDFGLRSDPPMNPELLDYLAAEFMTNGWSVKKLHRLIMLSATYQQSSQDNPDNDKIDPGNQLVWRMNRQRLDFEALRDTLLAVSGKLDMTVGGRSVEITKEPFPDRRTVYGYVDRQNLPNLFRAFDFASPDATSPRRFYTTVPQQALYLMNDPFVIDQAKNLVNRPEFTAAKTDDERLRRLYQLAFQRDPNRQEIKWAHDFIHAKDTDQSTATNRQDAPHPEDIASWEYGYGGIDETTQRVKTLHKLPFFDGKSYQGGPDLPDKKLAWVVVNATGGHPGKDQKHASIRRWVVPRDGTVNIRGTLEHTATEGDGVRGRIVSSETGVLGEWKVHHDQHTTEVEKVTVHQGETIDFVTDCLTNDGYDSYTWAPIIRFVADAAAKPGERLEWNAQDDFGDTTRVTKPPLTDWQEYAQVLLLANELVFVD